MNRFLKKISVGTVVVILAAVSLSAQAAALVASNARIVLPRDESIATQGFVTLKNTSDQEIILIKVRSTAFGLSMIHQSIDDQGEKRMMLKSELIIKPGAEMKMSRNGLHLMFAGPKQKLKKGDKVKVNLYLNTGDRMPVEFELVK